jgi:hypothetical protein
LFIKRSLQGKVTVLVVYADDIIPGMMMKKTKLRKYLANEFETKDLESLKYFLGIEMARSRHRIFISQWKYILDLLKKIGMLGCKAVNNPVKQSKKLVDGDESSLADKGTYHYQQLVGRLIFVTHPFRHCLCNEPFYAFTSEISYRSSLHNTSVCEIFTK